MKNVILVFILILFSSTTENKQLEAEKQLLNQEKTLLVYNFEQLEPLLKKTDDKTYVINFWATWCAPCVKELPYFEKLNAEYSNKKVEVILVSLDFPKHIDTRLKPFLLKNKLKSQVILLDDVDSNSWIPKVDKDWSGAIPATLIYNQKQTIFYERSFEYKELENELKQFLN
ncbi:MAG: TlpA family protein disulfide reductase [Olleya sp.]